ncbi:MAG: GDP-mannose 4,6-dehydratase [Ramlibacter sp.]|nr:GDP-mannose 4,6-dehydratase [Ramlibacter sp.]
MRVLVTGLSGFVGSWCAQQFNAIDLADECGLVDLRDEARVRHAVAAIAPEAVLHLAGQSSVALSLISPSETYDINCGGTHHLLRALGAAGFRGRMLYVGSADVYGAVAAEQLPITEDCPVRPLNPYAASKVAAEALCAQWSQRDFEIVVARPFNHIGPRQSTQFAVADFARQIVACRAGRSPARLVVGNIDITRDFTDVRDIVRAYAALLQSGRNGEAYNVCSGVERSMSDIIDALCSLCGVKMDIEIDAERLRPTEQLRMRGTFAKLAADTGWAPQIAFEQTLRDIVDYWDKKDRT